MARRAARGKPSRSVPPVALVTGAARRIGADIALGLAADGWRVAVHHNRSAHEAAAIAGRIVGAGGEAAVLAADLSDDGETASLVPRCCEALGPPRLLVNNASLFLEDTAATLTPEQWDLHAAVNLKAPVFLARQLATHLPAGDEGTVVNLIDQRVWRPTPLFFSYAVSKAGLWAATRMLAQALAPRIRVNAIGPGPVLQSIYQSAEAFERQWSATLLQRQTRPEEVLAAIRYILSAPAMTGQMIALDGGQHLAWKTPDVEDRDLPATGPLPSSPPRAIGPGVAMPRPVRHVIVRDLEIKTVIGVHDYEKRAAQRILVNADLAVEEEGPALSDRLDDVLDYAEVVRNIERIARAGHVNLVETLAERVAAWCLEKPRVLSVRIRIEKPDVINNAAGVGIEITRSRGPF